MTTLGMLPGCLGLVLPAEDAGVEEEGGERDDEADEEAVEGGGEMNRVLVTIVGTEGALV